MDAKRVWSANSYLGLHNQENPAKATYDFYVLCLTGATVFLLNKGGLTEIQATTLGLVVSVGPIVLGVIVNKVVYEDRMSQLWPFHRETWGLLYTAVSAGVFCVLPVFHFVKWCAMIEQKGEEAPDPYSNLG